MANHFSHALKDPVRKARFTFAVPYANPDNLSPTFVTKVSKDGGAFADAAEEVTGISGPTEGGVGYVTLTGAETDCGLLIVWISAISGQTPTILNFIPRDLPVIASDTASAGSASSLTLAATASGLEGCIVRLTGGTGGGGTGGANNQARYINSVSGSTVNVSPNWETTPDNTTTYEILRTELQLSASGGGGGSGPTASEVADAVWDEARAGHTSPGSFGEGIASVQGNVTGNVGGNVGGNVTGSVGSVTSMVTANVIQISGDSTAADNAESFFDGTGYAGTNNVIPTVTTVTNMVTANVTQISGDSTAADNAESFFDGTGYAGTNNVIPTVTNVGTVATVTNMVTANVIQISGDSTAADNAESFFDGTGYAGTNNVIPTVTNVSNVVSANVTQLSGDSTAADNAEAFFDGTGYAGTNNVIPTVTNLTNPVTANVTQISGDSTAADNLEAALDGTGGVTITAAIAGNITGNLSGSVGSLAAQAKADVNAEVDTALEEYDSPKKSEMDSQFSNVNATILGLGAVIYQARITFLKDGSRDEYTVTWCRNGTPVKTGITSPSIQVIKRLDGSNLVSPSTMTQIASTGTYKYDATGSQRQTGGEAALVIVKAVIDGSEREDRRPLGRDS